MAGWFDYHLRDDARYAPWVFADAGGAVEEDRMAGRIAWQETADSGEAWRFIHFGSEADNPAIAGDLADPDEDGFPNLLEYTLNTDPKNPASRPEVSLGLAKVNGRNHLTLTFARISRAPDLVYRIQASDNLWQWHSLREFLPGEDPPDQEGVRIEGKGLQQITVTDNSPLAAQNPRFLRLQVVRQPQPDT